jgi:DNA-binding response OmpR family regulator
MPVVLLVDDQPFIAAAVKALLTAAPDIQLNICHDSRQARELAARIRPAVVLIDLMMPDIDGLTLIGQMRADSATTHIPLIALSGNDDDASRRKAFAAGASDFVLKLPAASELIATIRRHAADTTAPRRTNASDSAPVAVPAAALRQTEQTLDQRAIAELRDLNPETGTEFFASLVDLFITEAAAQLELLRDAVGHGNSEAMRGLAHRLAGSSQTIGARRLAALSGQLEDHAIRNRGAAVGRVLLAEIDKEFTRVQNALAVEVERPKGATP